MGDSRRIVLALTALVVVVAFAAGLWWRAETNRHEAMQATVRSFEPPAGWIDWTPVRATSRGFNPFCIDTRCPSYSERHVVAVPEGDRKPEVVAALEALDLGAVIAPSRSCSVDSECLYRIDGGNLRVSMTVKTPLDIERSTLPTIPTGFVEAAVTISAS